MSLRMHFVAVVVALVAGVGCAGGSGARPAAPVAAHTMTYAECQASAEYPGFTDGQGTAYAGGRYAVEYDNGVCKVQRP